jgi:hypothetical protein
VAAKLGVTPQTVGKWRARFVSGRLDGLHDEPRPGVPRVPISNSIDLGKLRASANSTPRSRKPAAFFGCAKRALLRHLDKPDYRDAWEAGRPRGKASLRRLSEKHQQWSVVEAPAWVPNDTPGPEPATHPSPSATGRLRHRCRC